MSRFKQWSVGVVGVLLCTCLALSQQPPAKQPPSQKPPGKPTPGVDKSGAPQDKTTPPKSSGDGSKEPIVAWTFDGARIEGDFYPPPEGKGKKTPVLMLLHAVGKQHLGASRADFGKLPEKLQKSGYAVATFDFRGYGKSKTISTTYWNYNQPRSRTLDRLEARDFTGTVDLLHLVNDVVAVKVWLNKKNNMGDCNSNLLGVIGVETGAEVGVAWAANEFLDFGRSKERQAAGGFGAGGGFNGGGGFNPGGGFGNGGQPAMPRLEGEDIACFVAVSMPNRLGETAIDAYLGRWLGLLRDRQVAVLSLYGANDKDVAAFWKKAIDVIKPPHEKTRFKNSKAIPVKGTSLAGTKLLLNDTLDLTKTLEEYMDEAVKKAGEAKLWVEQPNADKPQPADMRRLVR